MIMHWILGGGDLRNQRQNWASDNVQVKLQIK